MSWLRGDAIRFDAELSIGFSEQERAHSGTKFCDRLMALSAEGKQGG
jgi:hypothetical protein